MNKRIISRELVDKLGYKYIGWVRNFDLATWEYYVVYVYELS